MLSGFCRVRPRKAAYGRAWTSIINNSGSIVYYGGNDPHTAEYFSQLFNVPSETLLEMPLGYHYTKKRGQKPCCDKTMFFRDGHGIHSKCGEAENNDQKER